MQYSVLIQFDAADGIYVASVPELPGCMAHGKTREDAIREVQIAMQLFLDTVKEKGIEIPVPMTYVS